MPSSSPQWLCWSWVRGQWRVERQGLEEFVARKLAETARWVVEHPFTGQAEEEDER